MREVLVYLRRFSVDKVAMNIRDVKQFWKKSQQDMIFVQATALAYTSLLSLVPVLAVAFFIFQAFGGMANVIDRIQPLIEQNLAPAFSDKITTYLDQFMNNTNKGSIGIFGLIGFIATAVMTLSKIEQSFNIIWGVNRQRSWGYRITTYWTMLTIGPLLLGASLILSSQALVFLKSDTGDISRALQWSFTLVPYFTSGLLFTFVYYFIPNISVRRRDALKAGIVAGLVFEIAKLVYAQYAAKTLTQASIYGSLVIIPVFLLWLYVVWLIVLFGAELCCFFKFKRLGIPYRFSSTDRLNPFILADILEDLALSAQAPKSGMTLSRLLSELKLPMHELILHLDFLEDRGWIVCQHIDMLGERKYHLAVNKDALDMAVVMDEIEGHRYKPRSPHGIAIHKRFLSLWKEWDIDTKPRTIENGSRSKSGK